MGEHDIRLHSQPSGPSYSEDWAAWLATQVELLKSRRYDELDHENLVDEVEGLSKSDFKAWLSAFRLVLLHMLKWDYQPEYRTRSWQGSINVQRLRILGELEDSPSYARRIEEATRRAYGQARAQASDETDLPLKTFPETCPYDWAAITAREHLLPGDDA